MAGNSLPRRIAKRLLAPVLNESTYSVLQAVAMGWDIRRGAWYEAEIELLPLALREGESAVDIGANFGLYAYHLSRAVGRGGKVWSFEPIPFTARTFKIIQRALGFGSNVELVPKGCGERTERVQFTVPVMKTGAISAGLVHMGRNDDRPGKGKHANYETKAVECEVVALDDFLGGAKDVALVKCDIEGADLFAMRGAKKLLERHHPTVIIEITPWYLEGFGIGVKDITGFFESLGYRCYRYDNGSPVGSYKRHDTDPSKRRLVPTRAEDIYEDNWVFIHPERESRFRSLLAS
ncbi:MAG: FkbM family methyltransferase [Deltaproteobacteria bacterium]|nr:FkbM family methyltransferase [Deltaproteobacteria bacterium]